MTIAKRRAVVVDDESGARVDLLEQLARHPQIEVVGEATDVDSAIAAIGELRPDLIFLDIQLGRRSGFEVLDGVSEAFEVIFVTAHDQYALRAFEVNALDYLLKPVDAERLAATLERLADTEPPPGSDRPLNADDWLFLPVGRGRRFVRVRMVSHITAAGDYTTVHTHDGRRYLVHTSLTDWDGRLPATQFLRIHRGTLVNLERVDRVEPWSNHTYQVHLRDVAAPLTMSRNYARRAERLLG